jgi:hypothetical protein
MSARRAHVDRKGEVQQDPFTGAMILTLALEAEKAVRTLAFAVTEVVTPPLRKQPIYQTLSEVEAAVLTRLPLRLECLGEVFYGLRDDAELLGLVLKSRRRPPRARTGPDGGDASKAPGEP